MRVSRNLVSDTQSDADTYTIYSLIRDAYACVILCVLYSFSILFLKFFLGMNLCEISDSNFNVINQVEFSKKHSSTNLIHRLKTDKERHFYFIPLDSISIFILFIFLIMEILKLIVKSNVELCVFRDRLKIL